MKETIKKLDEELGYDVQEILDDLFRQDDDEWMEKHPKKDARDVFVELVKKYNHQVLELVKGEIENLGFVLSITRSRSNTSSTGYCSEKDDSAFLAGVKWDFEDVRGRAISIIDRMIKEVTND